MTTTRPARPLLVLTVAGTQEEMGRQHGEILRRVGGWEGTLAYYPRMPEILLGGERGGIPPAVLRPMVTLALRVLHRDRPRLYRERTRAFLEALGRPARDSHHLFVMDLLQNVVGLAGRFGVLGPSRRLLACAAVPSCSSVAVWGRASKDGALRHARNFDFPGAGVWERQPAVVFCRPDGGQRYGFVTTRGADVPGVTAFNEAGLTLGAHTRFHRHVRFSGAGIIDLGHEIIRRAETLADAVRIARERPVASTWGFLVSSAREKSAALIEITGRAVDVVRPREGEDFLGQTNRYRSARLLEEEVAPMVGFVANSDGRARSLRSRIDECLERGGADTSDLESLLAGCVDLDGGCERPTGGVLAQPITVKSVVAEPEARRLRVSVGPVPTSRGPWVTVPFEWDGAVGGRVVEPPAASARETADRERAREAFVEAVALDGQGARRSAVVAELERAVALDPREPVYRFLAGSFALQRGDGGVALDHYRRGLERERGPFARGQLLLWASRAARACGRGDDARAFASELEELDHPLLLDAKAHARAEASRPLAPRALRSIVVNLVFPDAALA